MTHGLDHRLYVKTRGSLAADARD